MCGTGAKNELKNIQIILPNGIEFNKFSVNIISSAVDRVK